MFVPKDLNTYKVYEQKNAIQKDHTLGSYYISQEKYNTMFGFSVQPHDIIVSCAGTIGETYVLPDNIENGIINQALMIIRLFNREIERFYLLYFDYILKEQAYKESKGTAIKNIPPFDVLKNFFIPIPPIAEQIRILKAVDKWLTFVNSIDESKSDLLDIIKQTKSKILDLAIHGKLVPQDPADEPASELLKRVNPSAEITCDNEHYPQLPNGWILLKGKYVFNPLKSTKPKTDIFKYIDIDSIDNKKQCVRQIKKLAASTAPSRASRYTRKGDVLFAMVRPYLKNIAIVPESDCIASTGFYICSSNGIITTDYCYYLMSSDYVINGLNQYMKGDNSPSISKNDIENWEFPIPPINEQIRITESIKILFSKIDNIAENL